MSDALSIRAETAETKRELVRVDKVAPEDGSEDLTKTM